MTRCAAIVVLAAACAAACSPASAPAPGSAPASGATDAAKPADPKPPAPAPAEAKPQFRDVTIPAGTTLHVKLADTVASNTSKVEDAVRGELTQAVDVDGQTAVPAGARVR